MLRRRGIGTGKKPDILEKAVNRMIILGMGSNLPSKFGDRFNNVDLANKFLEEAEVKIIKKSSYYETPSYPDKRNPKFINIVISVSTNKSLKDLAITLADIENKFDRIRIKKNEPRTCDIDIIDYNGEICNLEINNLQYSIPHEKLSYRNFVLYPLREIVPEWKHPKTNEHINKLIENLSPEEKNSILMINKP